MFTFGNSFAQVNISGKPGIINTPSAVATDDGLFRIGYNFNPAKYSLRPTIGMSESIFFANITFLKRFELNANILRLIETKDKKRKDGIGDRQLDVRYLILKEKKNRPSVAIILTNPFTIDGALLTHALVATKTLKIQTDLKLEMSLGYGSPYYLYRNVDNYKNSSILNGFKWQKKSTNNYKNHYLQGPFGGAILHYRKIGGLMVEYDEHLNIGMYVTVLKSWTIQAALLNGNRISFGSSYAIPLLKSSRRLKQQSDEAKK